MTRVEDEEARSSIKHSPGSLGSQREIETTIHHEIGDEDRLRQLARQRPLLDSERSGTRPASAWSRTARSLSRSLGSRPPSGM